jgi:hypothetical protein
MEFTYPAKVIHYEGEPGSAFAGLKVSVQQVRTWIEYRTIADLDHWTDIHETIAPYVLDWNVKAPVRVTETVPPIMADDVEIAPAHRDPPAGLDSTG